MWATNHQLLKVVLKQRITPLKEQFKPNMGLYTIYKILERILL